MTNCTLVEIWAAPPQVCLHAVTSCTAADAAQLADEHNGHMALAPTA